MPRVSLPGGAGLAPEAGRVGDIPDRQPVGLDDLVAMDVGDRDLCGRHQVEIVARDDVHLVFLVRDLPGAAGGRGVDEGRWPDLGHAVLARVEVEEEVDERALERRASAAIDREPGAGDLGARGEVDHAQGLAHLPVGRAVVTIVEFVGRRLAPRADDDAGLFAADGHARIGRVGDPQQQLLEPRLDLGEVGIEGIDARTELGRALADGSDLWPGRGPNRP